MPDSLPSIRRSLIRLADALGGALERDPALRASARDLLRQLLTEEEGTTVALEPGQARGASPQRSRQSDEQGGSRRPLSDHATKSQLEELSARLSAPTEPQTGPAPSRRRVEAHPRWILERCRLKQRACGLAAELDEIFQKEGELRPHENFQVLIGEAKTLPDCYLWMLRSEIRGKVAPEQWLLLGHCYENLADAIQLAHGLVESGTAADHELQEGLSLAAEAQRAVRQAVVDCIQGGKNLEDSDQLAAYRWILHQCESLRVFVPRYMKIDDLADPREWADLQERIQERRSRPEEIQEKRRELAKGLSKVRYESQRLAEASPDEAEERVEKIAGVVEELVKGGLSFTDSRLRDLLSPIMDRLIAVTEKRENGFSQLLREMVSSSSHLERERGDKVRRQ